MVSVLMTLVCVVLNAGTLSAQITVDHGGGEDLTDLQPAIDAATPLSVIHVIGGSYGPVQSPAIDLQGTGPEFLSPDTAAEPPP